MDKYIDIVSVKEAITRGILRATVNEYGNILLIDQKSRESVKIGETETDMVPVVRCSECQNLYAQKGDCGDSIATCKIWKTPVCYDEFCRRGIRKKA